MSRYGNEITLLDATYKAMLYELPLFFLVVKTNVNFVVVDSFIIQNETTASIEEALNVFCTWNPTWSPQFFMTDFRHEEINAIESTFEELIQDTDRQAADRASTSGITGTTENDEQTSTGEVIEVPGLRGLQQQVKPVHSLSNGGGTSRETSHAPQMNIQGSDNDEDDDDHNPEAEDEAEIIAAALLRGRRTAVIAPNPSHKRKSGTADKRSIP